MKNNDFLQDAFGLIDDDLITDAKKPIKKRNLLRITSVTAACVAILLTAFIPLFLNEDIVQQESSVPPNIDESYSPKYFENIWDKSDFSALSIVYSSKSETKLLENVYTESDYLSDTAIESEKVEINVDSTIKVESVLSDRYIVYFSKIGYPIIYDIEEQKEVDLTDRIIGSERVDGDKICENVIEIAEQSYPGISSTENNRAIIYKIVTYWINHQSYDESSLIPDIEFLKDNEIYGAKYEVYMPFHPEDLYYIFFNAIWDAYCQIPRDDLNSKPYGISILWIDYQNGRSLVRTRDINGQTIDTLIYDVANDTIIQLSVDNLGNFTDGYEIEFSNDGSFFTVTRPVGTFNGISHDCDYQSRYSEVPNREIINYKGESYSIVYIDNFRYVDITGKYNDDLGCSKAYFSEKGKVVYYKLMTENLKTQYFKCDADVWYNRLARFDSDDDIWVFCTFSGEYSTKTKLQGNFVKFACNESVVIMEKDGQYRAYLAIDGNDVTEQVITNEIKIEPNERLTVYYSENALYRKDLFTNQIVKIIDCDNYILNDDNTFAFAYKKGDNFVTCLNVVTDESRRIIIDDELCNQIFADKNAVFKMNYNEIDNTLSLSFYKNDEVKASEEIKDFYSLISEIDDNLMEFYQPELCGKLITDYTISDSVLNAFREYVIEYEKYEWNGHDPIDIYPLELNYSDKYQDVLEKLGITPTIDYIDMNGTCFILYEDEDERIEFYIEKWMPIYDPPADRFGNNLCIIYYQNGKSFELI